ncbi:MAG: nucleotide exchange factor GrpE [Bdellovibrionota bacterium]
MLLLRFYKGRDDFKGVTQYTEKFSLHLARANKATFDPNLHEAMSNVEDDSVAPNTRVQEHQKLYRSPRKAFATSTGRCF